MLDSPLTLILLGISAMSAVASYTAVRRRRRSTLPALSALSDADLLATLAALRSNNSSGTAQQGAERTITHSISVMHAASGMRESGHPNSASSASEEEVELRRNITLLVIEEIERRRGRPRPYLREITMALLVMPWGEFLQQIIGMSLLFLPIIVAIIVMGKIGIEHERAKRSGIDVGQIDKIIEDARRRANRRGYDDPSDEVHDRKS